MQDYAQPLSPIAPETVLEFRQRRRNNEQVQALHAERATLEKQLEEVLGAKAVDVDNQLDQCNTTVGASHIEEQIRRVANELQRLENEWRVITININKSNFVH
jgi:predicted nuclease with TOPRIM domain